MTRAEQILSSMERPRLSDARRPAKRAAKPQREKPPGVPQWPDNAKLDYETAARLADEWISIGYTKGEIKQKLEQIYGIGYRSAERVLSRARKIARRRAGLSTEQLRQRAHDVYQAVISSDKSTQSDRLKAQRHLCKLYGIEAPTQSNVNLNIGIKDEEAEGLLRDEEACDLLDAIAERLHEQRNEQHTPSDN